MKIVFSPESPDKASTAAEIVLPRIANGECSVIQLAPHHPLIQSPFM
jgi:hypothetical protein